jgi:hypothetical protein
VNALHDDKLPTFNFGLVTRNQTCRPLFSFKGDRVRGRSATIRILAIDSESCKSGALCL